MSFKPTPLFAALLTAVCMAGTSLVSMPVLAADAPATQARAGWYTKIVNQDFVKQQAVVPQIAGVMLIDSRPAARKYDLGHIPTAVNIPDSAFDKLAPTLLPPDKATLLPRATAVMVPPPTLTQVPPVASGEPTRNGAVRLSVKLTFVTGSTFGLLILRE